MSDLQLRSILKQNRPHLTYYQVPFSSASHRLSSGKRPGILVPHKGYERNRKLKSNYGDQLLRVK